MIETIYLVQNSEPFIWNGNTYNPAGISIDVSQDNQEVPSCTLTVTDITLTLQAVLQVYGWAISWPLRIKIVNATTPTLRPEWEYDFEILSAICKDADYTITFTIGAENPLSLRFPPRQQFNNQCFWHYKDASCGYTGSLPTCDYTFTGTNGCKIHGNTINFGGFPGLHAAN